MRAGKQHPRPAPANSANAYTQHSNNVSPNRAIKRSSVVEDRADPSENLTANSLPTCDAPDKFKVGKELSLLDGELRRHVYRRCGRPLRIKIKLERDGEKRFQNWYAVIRDGVPGWQAQKPGEYVAVPYFASLDPFDEELTGDDLIWPEGEKDVDTLARLNIPAFTFGGTGDGLPLEAARYLKGRRVVILADNDDGGRAHSRKRPRLPRKLAQLTFVSFIFQNWHPKTTCRTFSRRAARLRNYTRVSMRHLHGCP